MKAIWIDTDDNTIEFAKSHLPNRVKIDHYSHLPSNHLDGLDWPNIDLLLMEMKLHDVSTLSLVPEIRKKKPNLPILIVTAHASKENCIQALNLGVNGLFEKPVDYAFLKTTLEKFQTTSDELPLNHERKAVYSGNKWIDLTSTEYRILESLKIAQRRMTRAELQGAVWPGSSISENNLDTHLTNLKKKIPELNQYLNVKRGLGYFLTFRTQKP